MAGDDFTESNHLDVTCCGPTMLRELGETTETIDLGQLLTDDRTDSGSFDLRNEIWATTFGKLTQSLPIPALLINREHEIIVANQACARITPDYKSVLGRSFLTLVQDPGRAQAMRDLLDDVFETRRPRIKEEILKFGKGGIWGRVTLRSLRVRDDRLLLALIEDITQEKKQLAANLRINRQLREEIRERRQAEINLAYSEKQYRDLVELATDIIYRTTPDGTLTFINSVGLRITGYGEEEVLGRRYWQFVPAAYQEAVKELYARQLAGRESDTYYEFPLMTKAGRLIWLGQSVQLLTEAELVVGFQAIARDITDRRNAERMLQDTLARLNALVDAIPDMVCFKDVEGRNLFVNRAFEAMTGLSKTEIIGKTDDEILPPDLVEECRKHTADVIENRQSVQFECSMNKGEEQIFLEVNKFPVLSESEELLGLGAAARDISERKTLESKLRHGAKMEAVGTLAGGIAHDFNNLLQVITGYADLLLFEKGPDDPDYPRIRSMRSAAARGSDLVQRILTFSTKAETKPKPISLNHHLLQMEELISRTISRTIKVELSLSEDLFTISADPVQIEQVVLNLVTNSMLAMSRGGRLLIATENAVLDEAFCRLHPEVQSGPYATLVLEDSGVGMSQDIMDRIFEPFFTTRRPGEGSGLGLAVVFGIVKAHGGHIFCKSEPSKGTEFRIYFPALDLDAERDVDTTQEMPAFGSETVLVVDDEDDVRDLGAELLSGAGYRVLKARNGLEAVEVYTREKDSIALVILDLVMPEMSGEQCLQELVKINPEIKVVVTTGHHGGDLGDQEVVPQVKNRLKKPYKMKELLRTVRSALDF